MIKIALLHLPSSLLLWLSPWASPVLWPRGYEPSSDRIDLCFLVPLPLSVYTLGPAETSPTPCLHSQPSTRPVCLVSRPLSFPHLYSSILSSLPPSLPPSGPRYPVYPFLSSIVDLFILQAFLSCPFKNCFYPLLVSCLFTASSIHLSTLFTEYECFLITFVWGFSL